MQILLLRSVKRVRDATRKAKRGQVEELERRNRRAVELTKTQSLRGPSAIFTFSTSPSKRCKFCCCAASNGFATQRGKRSEVKWRNSNAGIGAPLNSPKRNPLGDPQQFSFFRLHVETMQILLLRSVKRDRDATRNAKGRQWNSSRRRPARTSRLGLHSELARWRE
jgi:hypothetical protein